MQRQASRVEPAVHWQSGAVGAYQRAIRAQRAALAATLAAQLRRLTGHRIPAERIATDTHGRYATTRVDDVLFRRYAHGLVLVRPCAMCDTGAAESPVIETPADLGYALAVWYPSHEHVDDDAVDLGDW